MPGTNTERRRNLVDRTAMLRLLTWLSPSFPTGAYAYSHGLEWAIAAGDVTDRDSCLAWLGDIITYGTGRSDVILLRHAYRAVDDIDALVAVAELAAASAAGLERQAETLAQGAAFAAAAAAWPAVALEQLVQRCAAIAYPLAVGVLAASHGIDEEHTVAGYLHAFAANLISAAVRLVPLGQSAGLRVLAALEGTIEQVAAATAKATLNDVGGSTFRADIAMMQHETQYTRLFRS
jgi:urease accessory protein